MAERAYYRNEEEFKAALDKAVEAIDAKRRAGRIDAVIWFGLWAVLALLYVSRWAFGWRLHAIVPGVDLRSVTWILLIGYFVLYHIRARHKHTFILRGRQCLECGEKLLKVDTNDTGDGTCPTCGRDFNLGEYRRPAEQRGARFQSYIDADHFDKAMHEAGERVMKRQGLGLERDLIGGAWIALGIAFGFNLLLDINIFGFLPGSDVWFWVWLAVMSVWSGTYTARVKRIVPSLVPERRCLECGYSLLGTPMNDDGLGRCPECASAFAFAEYERPEERDGDTRADTEPSRHPPDRG